MHVKKITPVLFVQDVEPCVKFWVDRFGFEKTAEVPDGDHLAFAMLQKGNVELMYQSLKRLGVPTMLVVYPGEYHDFVRPSFIKDLHQRYLFWYAHYVKGEGPASPPEAKGAD